MRHIDTIPTCHDCVCKYKSIFKHLKKEEMDILSFEKSCNFYKRGNIIYNEGNRTNGVYCVNKGVLKIFKTGLEAKEQIVRFAQAGDIIGYRSILSGELACTTAKVIDDAILCFIPANTLIQMVRSNPDFSMELMQMSCRELGEANSFILDIAQKTVRERLAEVLLLLKETFNLDKENNLQISLTREEIANIVGTATESVIRLLSEFKADKLIELNGRRIKLLDVKALHKISNIYK